MSGRWRFSAPRRSWAQKVDQNKTLGFSYWKIFYFFEENFTPGSTNQAILKIRISCFTKKSTDAIKKKKKILNVLDHASFATSISLHMQHFRISHGYNWWKIFFAWHFGGNIHFLISLTRKIWEWLRWLCSGCRKNLGAWLE